MRGARDRVGKKQPEDRWQHYMTTTREHAVLLHAATVYMILFHAVECVLFPRLVGLTIRHAVEGALLVLWFALMEFIQIINYRVGLEDPPWEGGCKNTSFKNKMLVVSGYVHVCFQPLVTHYLLWKGRCKESGVLDPANQQFIGVLRLLVVSTLIDLSGVLEPLVLGKQGADVYDCVLPHSLHLSVAPFPRTHRHMLHLHLLA